LKKPLTLADLKPGESATIENMENTELGKKFCEMGCLPGCTVQMCYRAPLNGPLCLKISGSMLAVRKEDALNVQIKK